MGAGSYVAAIDPRNGREFWRTALREGLFKSGYSFVTVLVDGDLVYAHAYGYLYALDARTGAKLWENPLRGMGAGMASLAVQGSSSGVAPTAAYQTAKDEERRTSND